MPDDTRESRTVGIPGFTLWAIVEPEPLARIMAAGGLVLTKNRRDELALAIAHGAGWYLTQASALARAVRPADIRDKWQRLADEIDDVAAIAAATRGSWPIKTSGGLPGMDEARRDFQTAAAALRAKALEMVALAEPIVADDQVWRRRHRHRRNAALDRLIADLAEAWRSATGELPGTSNDPKNSGGPFPRFVGAILDETRLALPTGPYCDGIERAFEASRGALRERTRRVIAQIKVSEIS
jgi:hypothetical protein